MKKILSIQFLIVVLLVTSSSFSFSQDKFGGLTLYTVRNEMGSNPEETLKAVADVGYKYIEAADYKDGKFYGMSPEDFKNHVNELGMKSLSAHMGSVTLDNADEQIADAKAAGFKYFVIPVPPMGHFKFDRATRSLGMSGKIEDVTEILNTLGKKCNEAGLELLYHNHDFEFKKDSSGIVPIEYFMENTDPAYVNFQVDLYWVVKAGADPVAYMEKYPGRFKIWHIKDMDDQGRFAPVGTGSIDFAKILEKKEVSGMQYYIVEQDRTFDGMKPLEAIKISHDGLKKFGFN
jgi:sugar phosphate isomerase/epimerase